MKNFNDWNEVKKKTESENNRFYKEREIWWCRFGLNIGTEQNGKGREYTRPCLVILGFGPDACLVAPLTTSRKIHSLRIDIGLIENSPAKINISQMKVIDTKRLVKRICSLNQKDFENIRKTTRNLF